MLAWKCLNLNQTQPSLLWGSRGHHRGKEFRWCYVTLEIKLCLFLSLHVQPGWLRSGGIPHTTIWAGSNPNLGCRVIDTVSFELNSSGILIRVVEGMWRRHYLGRVHSFRQGKPPANVAIGSMENCNEVGFTIRPNFPLVHQPWRVHRSATSSSP